MGCSRLCFVAYLRKLLSPSHTILHLSDAREHMWVWEYETGDGANDMVMDIDEEIRFRVLEEVFMDISPTTSEADPVHYLLAARVCSGTLIIQTNEGFMCSLQLLLFLIYRYHSGNCFEKPQTNGALDKAGGLWDV